MGHSFRRTLTYVAVLVALTVGTVFPVSAESILVPMGEQQSNHLRAYGVTYWTLQELPDAKSHWLLNYQGGAFLLPGRDRVRRQLNVKGVSYRTISSARVREISQQIEQRNARKVALEKAPEIAVYTPPGKDPWDDAVTLALNYADIPFEKVYDREVLDGQLEEYDWVHLHHEDFSGQFGKFYANYRNSPWYMEKVKEARELAEELGYDSVQTQKKAVAEKISEYVRSGGFLFAMCSATETLDVALATLGLDSVAPEISGTPIESNLDQKMNFERTLAFTDFELITDPTVYAHSNIDVSPDPRQSDPRSERFELFDFSARYDPIPAMMTQNHKQVIKGFLGQSSSYNPDVVKDHVTEMAYLNDGRVKYLYGSYGEGIFSFFSGHDPEDFAHYVGDPHTTLSAHPTSPGYRLILNNILFPAAEKPDLKT